MHDTQYAYGAVICNVVHDIGSVAAVNTDSSVTARHHLVQLTTAERWFAQKHFHALESLTLRLVGHGERWTYWQLQRERQIGDCQRQRNTRDEQLVAGVTYSPTAICPVIYRRLMSRTRVPLQ